MSIPLLQFLTAAIWLIASICLVPAVVRAFSKRRLLLDEYKAVLFFAGLLFASFSGRWLTIPGDLDSWRMLYYITIALGIYVCALLWNGRK